MTTVKLILGTMQLGERLFGQDAIDLIKTFIDCGFSELDTAYVYNGGESERLIGTALGSLGVRLSIATKVHPRVTGRLDKDAVVRQVSESLQRMRVDRVEVLYLHFPDPNTPVESALEGCALLHEQGKFRELGLSNFPAWLVAEVYNICKRRGWVLPTVYQGLYNPLSRQAELELNDALDFYNMRFYAYNPLAGGLMTSKYADRTLKEGRFTNRPNYIGRYWHDTFFRAMGVVTSVCDRYGISITEAAYRWLAYHSMLNPQRGDGIVIGASNADQLLQNISCVKGGPLPPEVVRAMEEAWMISKVDAPEYFRFYEPTGRN